MKRFNNKLCITLTRDDLLDIKKSKSIQDIAISDFKPTSIEYRFMARKIIFSDGENQKILKERPNFTH